MNVALATTRYATLRAHPIARAALAAVLLAATGALFFGSLISDPSSRVLGGFNDAALGIRLYDVIGQEGANPFTYDRDTFNGAPEGVPTLPAVNYAAPVQPAVIWLLKGPLGYIGAMNAFILGGLLLTGIAMFCLLDRMRFGFLASLLGAYIVTFNPWMYERVYAGHAAFMHGWVLILLFIALVHARRSHTLRSAALAGVAYGFCFLMASYIGLLATALVGAFVLVELIAADDWAERLWTVTLLLIMCSLLIVFLLPGLAALMLERDAVTGALTRSAESINRLSAGPVNYLLPSPRHPLVGDIADRIRPEDTFNEKVLFFGYSTLVLAALGVAHLISGRRRARIPYEQRQMLVLAAVTGGVAVILSFGRRLSFGPVDIPMPGFLISEVVSFYRVYARFGFVVVVAAAILAAWMVAQVGRRRHGTAIAVALFALVVFETLPTRASAVVLNTPPAYDAWLAEQPSGIVAHYPMMTDRVEAEKLAAQELYYQRFTKQPLFEIYSTLRRGTREDAIRLLARYVTDPNAPGILAAEGVKYVVLHDDVYRRQGGTPPGLNERQFQLLRRFGDVRVYRLRAKPIDLDGVLDRKAGVIGQLFGIETPELRIGTGFLAGEKYLDYQGKWRWMNQDGALVLDNTSDKTIRARIEGLAFSHNVLRRIELVDSTGRVIARTLVDTFLDDFEIGPVALPPGVTRVRLRAVPGPSPLSGADPRMASIYLSPLSPRPLADYSKSLRPR